MPDYSLILSTNYFTAQWSLNGDSYDGLTWYSDTPKPTQAELDALWIPTQETVAKHSCKKQASELLYETDWTTIPDVADPANSPYLTNQAAFIAWRNQIRVLAVNPVVDPVFPPKPDEVWG
jgi:hypothetical protein